MSFRQLLASMEPDRETVLTIGVFDGVHQGHCHLLRRLVQRTAPQQISGAITFTNHPATVLRPDFTVRYITTPQQKVELLTARGMGLVVPLEFTPELSRISARDFTLALVETLKMRGLIIGPDFALGQNRQGNAPVLQELGAEMGFWVETVEPLNLDGLLVRSRSVREAIGQGDVATAGALLGRDFSLAGPVVVGNRQGRELGFPTANIDVNPEMMIPNDGIYATWAVIGGQRLPSATSIGIRPTFGLRDRVIEVHVMDFNQDIYGAEIGVEFVDKLRDQETFTSVEALVEQIGQDVVNARKTLELDYNETLAHGGGISFA
jgi:riboflavin kinase/FMN adenylyltransferase